MPQQLQSYNFATFGPFKYPERAVLMPLKFGPSLNVRMGERIAIVTATNLAGLYAIGGAGGLGKFVGLSKYAFVTDANGVAYLADTAIAIDDVGQMLNGVMPVYIHGDFSPALIPGWATGNVDTLPDVGGRVLPDGSIDF